MRTFACNTAACADQGTQDLSAPLAALMSRAASQPGSSWRVAVGVGADAEVAGMALSSTGSDATALKSAAHWTANSGVLQQIMKKSRLRPAIMTVRAWQYRIPRVHHLELAHVNIYNLLPFRMHNPLRQPTCHRGVMQVHQPSTDVLEQAQMTEDDGDSVLLLQLWHAEMLLGVAEVAGGCNLMRVEQSFGHLFGCLSAAMLNTDLNQ